MKLLINNRILKLFYDELYVTKEGLRIDPPTFCSIAYSTKQDITICGAPISKGNILSVNFVIPHWNPNEWYNPLEFIPERFDPESDYFFKPNSEKKETRNPNSYIPFSIGIRNCAGQTLAKLEFKVVLSRMITTLNIEIDEDQLKNDSVKFNLFSQMRLYGKISSKISHN